MIAEGQAFAETVRKGCVENGIDYSKTWDAAVSSFNAMNRKAYMEGVTDIDDAIAQYETEENPKRKQQLEKYIRKEYLRQNYKPTEQAEASQWAQDFVDGIETPKDKIKIYDKLKTVQDILGDMRMSQLAKELKPLKDEHYRIKTEESKDSLKNFEEQNKKILDAIRVFEDARRKINKEKNKLQDSSKLKNQTQDDLENLDINNEKTMIYIRQIRNRVLDEE